MPAILYPFRVLALGVRFQYLGHQKVWVKIGPNEIAEWDDMHKTDAWIGQSICSFAESRSGCDDKVFVL